MLKMKLAVSCLLCSGLLLGCTSSNSPLTVLNTIKWQGSVYVGFDYYDEGKPFVDDNTYVKWFPDGYFKAKQACADMYFSDVIEGEKVSTLEGELDDNGRLINGQVFRRYQCILPHVQF